MPDQPEPTERELLIRLVEAVEALPDQIAQRVGWKYRGERRLERDEDDSRAVNRQNREYERRRRAEFVDQAEQETGSRRWLIAIVIAGCALAVSVTLLLIEVL